MVDASNSAAAFMAPDEECAEVRPAPGAGVDSPVARFFETARIIPAIKGLMSRHRKNHPQPLRPRVDAQMPTAIDRGNAIVSQPSSCPISRSPQFLFELLQHESAHYRSGRTMLLAT